MNETPHSVSSNERRILVLEADEQLASAVLSALREAAPVAVVDVARNIEEAQRLMLNVKPDLFVLDADATADLGQDFLFDLRTSHPNARAIILTAAHLAAYRDLAAGIGAIHFLEKPFPHTDFVDLVGALLRPSSQPDSEKFQGTLSDLHLADIIQLKCMSGSTSALEFTGPQGEKARVYFDNGQVRHATAPGRDGIAAFNEIVNWKGGKISEVAGYATVPRTIDIDWQVLLMEAVRKLDETGAAADAKRARARPYSRRKLLVVDDSPMLLSFVRDILAEAGYDVATASTAAEGLDVAAQHQPELILLDYVLPDMKGGEVSKRLRDNQATADIAVVYMSGFGAELEADRAQNPNVIGALNKPFTSDLLLKTVETHLPKSPDEPEADSPQAQQASNEQVVPGESGAMPDAQQPGDAGSTSTFPPPAGQPEGDAPPPEWWTPPAAATSWETSAQTGEGGSQDFPSAAVPEPTFPAESYAGGSYFSGDSHFFSLNWALHTIGKEKLTGTLRCFWHRDPVVLFARDGGVVLVTTLDPELYCPEAPITLVSVDQERIAAARATQTQNGCPLFIALADEGLILREPALQLVQHYGQKLFAQLWPAPRVRFMFEQSNQLPECARDVPAEDDIDHWTLSTLRFIQFQELGERANYDPASIPAYTKDGFERVQDLRLTVAEAQFASQFNGSRSIAQIAKNLRLDLKFARLTLFRFLALEIVECWSASVSSQPQKKGMFQRFSRSIGIGE